MLDTKDRSPQEVIVNFVVMGHDRRLALVAAPAVTASPAIALSSPVTMASFTRPTLAERFLALMSDRGTDQDLAAAHICVREPASGINGACRNIWQSSRSSPHLGHRAASSLGTGLALMLPASGTPIS
jgi:hypothetical protein